MYANPDAHVIIFMLSPVFLKNGVGSGSLSFSLSLSLSLSFCFFLSSFLFLSFFLFFFGGGVVGNRFICAIKGLLEGANCTFSQFVGHNLIPVTLGNLLGGFLFLGTAQYIAYDNGPIVAVSPNKQTSYISS